MNSSGRTDVEEILIWRLNVSVFNQEWQVAKQAVHVFPQGVQENAQIEKATYGFWGFL